MPFIWGHQLLTLLEQLENSIRLTIFRYADIISVEGDVMYIDNILRKRNMTKYRLSVISGVPHATLNDLCNGKTKIDKCSALTVYKLSKALNIPMEEIVEKCLKDSKIQEERETLR